MRTISDALKAHLALERTTLAVCCKVTRRDATVYGFTSHSEAITFESLTYEATTGISASEFSTRSELNVDNMEIVGALDAASITEADLAAGLWDYAAFEFFIVNYEDLTQGRMILNGGSLGEVSVRDSEFVAELRGKMQLLQQNFGRAYMAMCDADYGDARCGHDPTSITNGRVTGEPVTAVTSQRAFTASGLAAASGFYDGGPIEWETGLNAGTTSEVKTFTAGGAITLQLPTPYAIAAADEFTITVGCDLSPTTCAVKFNNKINFRGFDKIPGRDRIMSGQA